MPVGSPTLPPGDHIRLLIELLRPLTPELARRWLAALLLVPSEERATVVSRIERRIVDAYQGTSVLAEPLRESVHLPTPPPPDDQAEEQHVHVVYPPIQRGGHVEQVVKTFAVATPASGTRKASKSTRRRA